jgi:hypothetical protein
MPQALSDAVIGHQPDISAGAETTANEVNQ